MHFVGLANNLAIWSFVQNGVCGGVLSIALLLKALIKYIYMFVNIVR